MNHIQRCDQGSRRLHGKSSKDQLVNDGHQGFLLEFLLTSLSLILIQEITFYDLLFLREFYFLAFSLWDNIQYSYPCPFTIYH